MFEEFEKEEFIRWYYGKKEECDKQIEIEIEKEEEKRWYYGDIKYS